MIAQIKQIVENYINNRQMTGIVAGTYKGGNVVINEKSYVPASILSGNLRLALQEGDRVKLLRDDGGKEYYILEIVGAPARLKREEQANEVI